MAARRYTGASEQKCQLPAAARSSSSSGPASLHLDSGIRGPIAPGKFRCAHWRPRDDLRDAFWSRAPPTRAGGSAANSETVTSTSNNSTTTSGSTVSPSGTGGSATTLGSTLGTDAGAGTHTATSRRATQRRRRRRSTCSRPPVERVRCPAGFRLGFGPQWPATHRRSRNRKRWRRDPCPRN